MSADSVSIPTRYPIDTRILKQKPKLKPKPKPKIKKKSKTKFETATSRRGFGKDRMMTAIPDPALTDSKTAKGRNGVERQAEQGLCDTPPSIPVKAIRKNRGSEHGQA